MTNFIPNISGERLLVVGAGSGHDMASAILASEYLRGAFRTVDLAGFLTPWAIHRFQGRIERPVQQLTRHGRKMIPFPSRSEALPFFEPTMLSLNKEMRLGIDKMYVFSLQHGTTRLERRIAHLCRTRRYDTILIVDVGGDILAREQDLGAFLTPLVDLACLRVFSRLPRTIRAYVTVIAPGACQDALDGRLTRILAELRSDSAWLGTTRFTKECQPYKRYVSIQEGIRRRVGIESHTYRIINSCIGGRRDNPTLKATSRGGIGRFSWRARSQAMIPRGFANTIVWLDMWKLLDRRSWSGFSFTTLLEAFFLLRRMGATECEIDLAIIPIAIQGSSHRNALFLLYPPRWLRRSTRSRIVTAGLLAVARREAPCALILQSDLVYSQVPRDVVSSEVSEDFVLMGRRTISKSTHRFVQRAMRPQRPFAYQGRSA